MHLVIDSTGLKLFGQGEWDEEKHGRTPRSWRKLHLAVDADTGEIVACMLTDNAGDRRKVGGQAATAIGGCGSLAGRNFCPKPVPSVPL
jgi:hypothetical protein